MNRNKLLKILLFALCLTQVLGAFCGRKKQVNPYALAQEKACIENLEAGSYNVAETHCQLCLEYDEKVPECMNGLGLVAFARGEDPLAISYFTKSIRISNNFAQARNNLGALYFRNLDFKKSIPFFEAAVKIDPGYTDARYNLGLSYLRLGEKLMSKDSKQADKFFKKAMKHYDKLIAVRSNFGNAYRDKGLIMTYLAQNEKIENRQRRLLTQANQLFVQCIQSEPGNEKCRESYGFTLLYQQRKSDEALYQFMQCLAVNKSNITCIKGVDESYKGSRLKSKAHAQYISRIKKNPRDAEAHYGYCKLLFDNGMHDQAIGECRTAVTLDKSMCIVHYDLALYFEETMNQRAAQDACRAYIICDVGLRSPKKITRCQEILTSGN